MSAPRCTSQAPPRRRLDDVIARCRILVALREHAERVYRARQQRRVDAAAQAQAREGGSTGDGVLCAAREGSGAP